MTEILRRAAKLMRERAEAATPGPWERPLDVRHKNAVIAALPDGEEGSYRDGMIPAGFASRDLEHIASWHPLVALAVAGWLDEVAADCHENLDAWVEDAALAVARAYLGETGSGDAG